MESFLCFHSFFAFSLFIVINVFSFLFVFLHVRLNALRIPQKSDVKIYDNYRTIYYPSIDILINIVNFFFVIKQKLYKIYKIFVNTRHVTVERHNCACVMHTLNTRTPCGWEGCLWLVRHLTRTSPTVLIFIYFINFKIFIL